MVGSRVAGTSKLAEESFCRKCAKGVIIVCKYILKKSANAHL
jgi:hypothetical protein